MRISDKRLNLRARVLASLISNQLENQTEPPPKIANAAQVSGRGGIARKSEKRWSSRYSPSRYRLSTGERRAMTDCPEFDWINDENIVVHEQHGLAVYPNLKGHVVIRQEAAWDDNDDPFFTLAPAHAVAFCQAVLDAAGVAAAVVSAKGVPLNQTMLPKPEPLSGAERQQRYRRWRDKRLAAFGCMSVSGQLRIAARPHRAAETAETTYQH
jgi:hypothetical protein